MKPNMRPARPDFSSGPCAKRPGWTPEVLNDAAVGRSHRSKLGKKKIVEAVDRTRAVLGIPADYKVGIVPASDTGAVEMALWSLLGARPVDMLAWESFGEGWITDVQKQLKLKDVRILKAGYGQIADLKQVDWTHDVVFTWNGTTSGVKVPNGDWIADDREGLAICDATSAVFAMDLPWQKLDVVTWSWQKVMGGEGAHGMLVLSPRAVKRLETYSPPWPMPKIFRMTSGGKFSEAIFKGDTINTPSLLCVEDAIDGLKWGESVGGLKGLMARSEGNLAVLEKFVAERDWIDFLAADKAIRSNTSVCVCITAPWFTALPADKQAAAAKKMADLLESEKAGYDVGGYRDAPPGLRIWCGAGRGQACLVAIQPARALTAEHIGIRAEDILSQKRMVEAYRLLLSKVAASRYRDRFIDLTRIFDRGERMQNYHDSVHPNFAGHQVLANALLAPTLKALQSATSIGPVADRCERVLR